MGRKESNNIRKKNANVCIDKTSKGSKAIVGNKPARDPQGFESKDKNKSRSIIDEGESFNFAPDAPVEEKNGNRLGRSGLSIMTLGEVGIILKVKDVDTVKSWLLSRNIQIHKFGKQCFVYEIGFNAEISKPFVFELKKKFPADWQAVYGKIEKDEALYHFVIRQIQGELLSQPSTSVKLKSEEDRLLFKELTAGNS